MTIGGLLALDSHLKDTCGPRRLDADREPETALESTLDRGLDAMVNSRLTLF